MAQKKRDQGKLEVTISIDETLLADFTEMIDEMKSVCSSHHADCDYEHTVDSEIEFYMKAALTQWGITKLLKKYL